jgi:hypothetical protein
VRRTERIVADWPAADMLVNGLGKDLGRFLVLVDKTDASLIFDLLRDAAAAEAARAAASVAVGVEEQPPLPFINGVG